MIDWERKVKAQPESVVLPEGQYKFTVVEVKAQDEPGITPRFNLQLRVETDNGDVTTFQSIFLTEKAEWQLGACAKCLGFYKEEGISPQEFAYEAEGREGTFDLKIETYEGVQRNKVKRWIKKEEPQKQETKSVGLDISPDDLPF